MYRAESLGNEARLASFWLTFLPPLPLSLPASFHFTPLYLPCLPSLSPQAKQCGGTSGSVSQPAEEMEVEAANSEQELHVHCDMADVCS